MHAAAYFGNPCLAIACLAVGCLAVACLADISDAIASYTAVCMLQNAQQQGLHVVFLYISLSAGVHGPTSSALCGEQQAHHLW